MHYSFSRLAVLGSLACTAAALAFASPAALAEGRLTPYAAEYKVEISVLNGELKTELRKTENGYSATHVVQATGMSRILSSGKITDTSEFSLHNSHVQPDHFLSDDSITRKGGRADIAFDWTAGKVSGTVNDQEYVEVLDGIVHDRVSIQYQLMLDLINGADAPSYVLFDVDEQKDVTITRIGSKQVEVPAGKFQAIGIQHQSAGSKRITTMWCVEELGYLPVVIEQHRKGKLRMRATLRKFTPDRI
jgi:hypothetical protein